MGIKCLTASKEADTFDIEKIQLGGKYVKILVKYKAKQVSGPKPEVHGKTSDPPLSLCCI